MCIRDRPLHAGTSGGAGCRAADSHHLARGAAPPTIELGGGTSAALPERTGSPAVSAPGAGHLPGYAMPPPSGASASPGPGRACSQ
eukprot:2844631-Prorocentrum_lima.AAC.1